MKKFFILITITFGLLGCDGSKDSSDVTSKITSDVTFKAELNNICLKEAEIRQIENSEANCDCMSNGYVNVVKDESIRKDLLSAMNDPNPGEATRKFEDKYPNLISQALSKCYF